MRNVGITVLAVVVLGAVLSNQPAEAGPRQNFEVTGVEGDDMLKLRAGPGTGFRVIVGLPNGTVLRVHTCEQIGRSEWCKVSLKEVRGLMGYVSWHYLQEL